LETFDTILATQRENLALVIGNGIHRHANSIANSWDELLALIGSGLSNDFTKVPVGTSQTEFFNAIELAKHAKEGELQAKFCEPMALWQPAQHHRDIMNWAIRHRSPVLTTNFDEVCSQAADSKFILGGVQHFTDRYPWACRFGLREAPPTEDFAIWHINGMARYKRSVRLGLTHYIGSAQYARIRLRGKTAPLFAAKDPAVWAGARTWLNILFHKPFAIFGLALKENEVFLRWLLLERAAYYAKYPERRQPAWFVTVEDPKDEGEAGKRFFLAAAGIVWVPVRSYADIYESPEWRK
jgi:hypothetical protein